MSGIVEETFSSKRDVLEAIQLSCSSFAWREVFAKIERKGGGGKEKNLEFFLFSKRFPSFEFCQLGFSSTTS